jgi:hypothetical protein
MTGAAAPHRRADMTGSVPFVPTWGQRTAARLIIATLVVLAAPGASADAPRDRLIGSWELVAVENRGSDGSVERPFGAHPRGRITYTTDGFLSAHVMHAERAPFATPGLYDGTPAEKAAAYDSYIAYYGRFDLDPAAGTITHAITGSLFPNWSGSSQTRFYAFDGDTLTLSTPPMEKNGKAITVHVVWRRAGTE